MYNHNRYQKFHAFISWTYISTYAYHKLMFIRDSRRSYRTYSYVELILITDLCAFRTPVGVTELMLMLQSLNLFGGTRRYHRDYERYTGISEHILVLRNLYWSYETYTCLTELILVLRNLYWSYGTYICIQDLFLFYGYGSTRRYYRTCTYLLIQEYP